MASRKGYTLLELMLVLVILITAAAMAIPLAGYLLNRNKISAAGDQIKSIWVKLRSRAMAEGRTYVFQVIEGTGKCCYHPDQESELDAESGDPPWSAEIEIEGIVFVSQAESLAAGANPQSGSGYETKVVFLPDGTCAANAVVVFGIVGEGAQALGVRGLTGTIMPVNLNKPEITP